MREDRIHPDEVLFLRLLSSCSHDGLVESGHIYSGNSYKDYIITMTIEHVNCMIKLFIHAGHLDESVAITLRIPCASNIVTWTTMLGVSIKWGKLDLGPRAFDNAANMGVIGQGEKMHAKSERQGLLEKSSVIASTLSDIHAKSTSLGKAHSVVYKLLVSGVIWGIAELELDGRVVKFFKQMKWEARVLNAVSVKFCLKACSNVGDVDKGQEIHIELIEEGFDSGYFVGSALISVYAKCGFNVEAQGVF
ncbi:hypothetical protein L7F22_032491 [Adiantum nelumboides]|nr:hypothetical protein [Adiantum nelumboides]